MPLSLSPSSSPSLPQVLKSLPQVLLSPSSSPSLPQVLKSLPQVLPLSLKFSLSPSSSPSLTPPFIDSPSSSPPSGSHQKFFKWATGVAHSQSLSSLTHSPLSLHFSIPLSPLSFLYPSLSPLISLSHDSFFLIGIDYHLNRQLVTISIQSSKREISCSVQIHSLLSWQKKREKSERKRKKR